MEEYLELILGFHSNRILQLPGELQIGPRLSFLFHFIRSAIVAR